MAVLNIAIHSRRNRALQQVLNGEFIVGPLYSSWPGMFKEAMAVSGVSDSCRPVSTLAV